MAKVTFAALLLIIILGGTYLGASMAVRSTRASIAQWRGQQFIEKLYAEYTVMGKSCQGEDTDSDAYVSCDFRIMSPSQEEKTVHLQCPDIWKALIGNSCKESRLVIPQ